MHICFFDIDGTLILTGGAGQAAFERAFFEDFGIDQWNGQVRFSGRSDRAIVADLFAVHGIENSDANWERFVTGYLERLPRTLQESNGRILPGVESLLELLASRDDVTLGLLTGNMRIGAERKLAHYGLGRFFEFGGYGDALLDRNEIAATAVAAARDYFEQAQDPAPPSSGERLGVGDSAHAKDGDRLANASTIVIGDTEHDVRCARSIGATAVAVATGFTDRPTLVASRPDLLLDDLADPTPFLELFGT